MPKKSDTPRIGVSFTNNEIEIVREAIARYKTVLRSRSDRVRAKRGHRDDSTTSRRYQIARSAARKLR